MDEIDVAITPYQMTPLNAVTKPFINQLKSFNEYNESQKSNSFMNARSVGGRGSNNLSKHMRSANELGRPGGFENAMLEGISEDGPNESRDGTIDQESDIKLLQKLFAKVQNSYKIDKVKLLN